MTSQSPAPAQERAAEVAEVEGASLRPLLAILDLLEGRYADMEGHGDLVGSYSVITGEALGLDYDRVNNLLLAGTLHDVGKLVIEEEVLLEPQPLDDDQWRQVQRHPQLGSDLLIAANLDDIAAWVLTPSANAPTARAIPTASPVTR